MKFFTVLVVIINIHSKVLCIDYDGWLTIKLEHSLGCDKDKYCSRGTIATKSIRGGTALVDQIQLENQHIDDLRELAQSDGFYSIRSLVTTAENREVEFLSSVKAQSFLDNGLSDVINVWILPNGAVTAVNFHATNSSQPMIMGNNGYKINSNFYLRYVDLAPVPDTASFIQKMEREREAREKGELTDNRSFLAKYWMYIVPIAIFLMISGAANPEPQAQGSR